MTEAQSKYDELVSEIFKNGNLGEQDSLLFYKLHQEVSDRNNEAVRYLLAELRDRKRYNEYFILTDAERKGIFEILEHKRTKEGGLDRYEYRYLTFLIWRYGFESSVNRPCYPAIVDTTLKEFENKFAFNSHRKTISETFKCGAKRCIELYEMAEVQILVGGSYTNTDKTTPNDIDPLILLPKQQWQKDRNHEIMNKIILEFKNAEQKNIFDLHKMLSGISENHYMNYELMTLMGNTPESKMDAGITTMEFKCKDLVRLKLKLQDLE